MKKYKNISGTTLHIDCITCTIHMEPGQVLFLPRCRDARFYNKVGKLMLIRKEAPIPKVRKSRAPSKRGRKKTRKWKKSKEKNIKPEKVETE